jgi:oligosaccharyltransferase complex subunit beta
VPTSIVSLLAELDIQLPADRTGLVVDHFNYDVSSAAELHDVVLVPPPSALRPDLKDYFGTGAGADEVLAFPRSAGVILGNGELLAPVVRAPRTAYLYSTSDQAETVDDLFASGAQLSLVATAQALNSARLSVLGSAEMLQDKWFDAKVKKVDGSAAKTFNREFAKRIGGWTFHELGVVRVNWIEHHLNELGGSNESNPSIYRVKNDVVRPASYSCQSHRAGD